MKQQGRARQNPSANGQTSLHFGKVSALDTSQYHVRVRIDELGMETFWLPSQNPLPEVGELVAVLLQNEGSGGLVLPLAKSLASRFKINFSDGTIDRYEAGTYELSGPSSVEVSANNTTIESVVAIEGSHQINSKATMVIGGKDTAGDTMIISGQ